METTIHAQLRLLPQHMSLHRTQPVTYHMMDHHAIGDTLHDLVHQFFFL